ncbi:MAG TPA: response regulator [Thermoanaerobaculia bacterium]|nr:response regulator [Thermoanaerobaculia bacterium]
MTHERRALVIDDDAAIRVLITRILARHGYVVDTARDGAEAIEMLAHNEYCVITLDLMMPRVDGFTVVKFLADYHPDTLEKVIVMTAYGSSARDEICPPVVRFVEKPFEIEALLAHAAECSSR